MMADCNLWQINDKAYCRAMPTGCERGRDVDVVHDMGGVLARQNAVISFIGPCVITHWRHSDEKTPQALEQGRRLVSEGAHIHAAKAAKAKLGGDDA
jgi:hypothetical protein